MPEKWAVPSIPNETTKSGELLSPWGHGHASWMSLPPLQWLQSTQLLCHVKARASLQLDSQKPILAASNKPEACHSLNPALPKLFSPALPP